jgi:CHASE2 domain-containing sensor protein
MEDNRTISFEAPNASPVIPPKDLYETFLMDNASIKATAMAINPRNPVKIMILATVKMVANAILLLSFIAIVNGELNPSQAGVLLAAIITITYFAIISAEIKLKRSFRAELKEAMAIINPIT